MGSISLCSYVLGRQVGRWGPSIREIPIGGLLRGKVGYQKAPVVVDIGVGIRAAARNSEGSDQQSNKGSGAVSLSIHDASDGAVPSRPSPANLGSTPALRDVGGRFPDSAISPLLYVIGFRVWHLLWLDEG